MTSPGAQGWYGFSGCVDPGPGALCGGSGDPSGAPPPAAPPSSGMVAWFRASDLTVGDPFVVLPSAVGGAHLTAIGDGTLPVTVDYFGFYTGLTFYGDGSDYLTTTGPMFSGANPRTVIAVWRCDTTAYATVCGQGSNVGADKTMFMLFTGGLGDPYLSCYNHDISAGLAANPNLQFAIASYDGGNVAGSLALRSSSVPGALTTILPTNTPDYLASYASEFVVGNHPEFNFALAGIVCEIIIYNRVLTSGEITDVQSYFQTKFGIVQAT